MYKALRTKGYYKNIQEKVRKMQPFPEHIIYKHTVIIGAGVSGLIAASSLVGDGVEVTVFEKARGTGGRMGSKRVNIDRNSGHEPQTSITFDLGASSFSSTRQEFASFLASLTESGVIAVSSDDRYVGSPRNSMITRHLSKNINVNFGQKITRIEKKDGRWHLFAQTQQNGRQSQSSNNTDQPTNSHPPSLSSEVLIATCHQLILAIPAEQASELLTSGHEAYELLCNIKSEPSFVSTFVVQSLSTDEIKHLATYSDSVIAEISLEHTKIHRESYGYSVLKLTTTAKWAASCINEGNDRIGELLLERFRILANGPNSEVITQYTHRWLYSQYNQLIPEAYLSHHDNLHIVGDYFNSSHGTKPSHNIAANTAPIAEGVERAFLSASQLTKKLLHDRLVSMSSEDSLEVIK
jgi:renalase